MTPETMAEIVLRAVEIREQSWVPDVQAYEIDEDDAVQLAVKEHGQPEAFWYPIKLAFYWSNDLIAWAEHIKAGKPIGEMFVDPANQDKVV